MQRRTREVLFWQVGGQILLGVNFGGDAQSENLLAYWILVTALLIFLLTLLLWLFSSQIEKVRKPFYPDQLKQPAIQAVLNDIAELQQQILEWQIRKPWIHNLGWIGLGLHITALVIGLQN